MGDQNLHPDLEWLEYMAAGDGDTVLRRDGDEVRKFRVTVEEVEG